MLIRLKIPPERAVPLAPEAVDEEIGFLNASMHLASSLTFRGFSSIPCRRSLFLSILFQYALHKFMQY